MNAPMDSVGSGGKTRAILTRAGAEFVTPLSLSALTGDKIYSDLFSLTDEAEMGHIQLSRSADLVVVAPAGMAPAARDLRVFLARGDQGVNYAAGVWHHPLLALDSVCDFLVLDRSGSAPNCDEVQLELHGLIPALS